MWKSSLTYHSPYGIDDYSYSQMGLVDRDSSLQTASLAFELDRPGDNLSIAGIITSGRGSLGFSFRFPRI